jgi:uncharacterized protein (TIGR00369 family)
MADPPTDRGVGSFDPAEVLALSGLEAMRAMMEGRLPRPGIGETMGFRLVAVEEGRVRFEARATPALGNPLGTLHGGVALTLVDSAAGCAGHTTLAPGSGYSTVETKVNFLKAVPLDGGLLIAEGRVISAGRRIILAEAGVSAADGRLVAHGTSTLIVLTGG